MVCKSKLDNGDHVAHKLTNGHKQSIWVKTFNRKLSHFAERGSLIFVKQILELKQLQFF